MGRPQVIQSNSTEYAVMRVADLFGSNVSTIPVQMAFMQGGLEPQAGNWVAASWAPGGPPYYARCNVGPAGVITLPEGEWAVWVRLNALPEDVQRKPGRLVIA